MKKLCLIITLISPFMLSAQKLLKPSIDKLTNDTTWATSEEKLYFDGNFLTQQGQAVTFQLNRYSRSKGVLSLVLIPQSLNIGEYLSIARGQKAYLKFTDNSIIVLNAAVNDEGNAQFNVIDHQRNQSSSAKNYYDFNYHTAQLLKTKTLAFLRIETADGDMDCDIRAKNARKLQKAVMLIEAVK